MVRFIHSKTHIKLHVLATQSLGPRSLCPLCSEAEVTRVAGRTVKKCCLNSRGRNHHETTSPVSALTARLDPR